MKLKQIIGLCILLAVFLLIGAVTKDLTVWSDWFITWGITIGGLTAIIVGVFLLLDKKAQEEIV